MSIVAWALVLQCGTLVVICVKTLLLFPLSARKVVQWHLVGFLPMVVSMQGTVPLALSVLVSIVRVVLCIHRWLYPSRFPVVPMVGRVLFVVMRPVSRCRQVLVVLAPL